MPGRPEDGGRSEGTTKAPTAAKPHRKARAGAPGGPEGGAGVKGPPRRRRPQSRTGRQGQKRRSAPPFRPSSAPARALRLSPPIHPALRRYRSSPHPRRSSPPQARSTHAISVRPRRSRSSPRPSSAPPAPSAPPVTPIHPPPCPALFPFDPVTPFRCPSRSGRPIRALRDSALPFAPRSFRRTPSRSTPSVPPPSTPYSARIHPFSTPFPGPFRRCGAPFFADDVWLSRFFCIFIVG